MNCFGIRACLCLGLSLVLLSTGASANALDENREKDQCQPGVFQQGHDWLVVSRLSEGEFRYVWPDGRRGIVGASGGSVLCLGEKIYVQDKDGQWQSWSVMDLKHTRIKFKTGDGIELVGELIESPTARQSQPPLIVMAHGSENFGWLGGNFHTPYLLAAQGLSVFIFDKRGTGLSGGKFHMNFPRLADDLVAASVAAKRLAAGRYGRFGLHGYSQGGWVAPLAAKAAGAEFMIINYGLVLAPVEEDAQQVQQDLRALGYSEEVLAKAREVTDAIDRFIISNFSQGLDEFVAVKKRYANEPWFKQIKGDFSHIILAADESKLVKEGLPPFSEFDVIWDYDSMPVLRGLDIPSLWIIAGADAEAPPQLTRQRLLTLKAEGRPVDVVVFPATDHGIVEFELDEDGQRRYTRYAEGYFRLLGDWSRACFKPPYGAAEFDPLSTRLKDCGK